MHPFVHNGRYFFSESCAQTITNVDGLVLVVLEKLSSMIDDSLHGFHSNCALTTAHCLVSRKNNSIGSTPTKNWYIDAVDLLCRTWIFSKLMSER